MKAMTPRHALAASLNLALASARDIPASAKAFYDSVTASNSQCANPLAEGFTSVYGQDDSFVYCSRNLDTPSSVLFIQGRGGNLSNMDICCDGIQGSPADDGRCDSDESNLSITAFQWIVESYNVGGQTDLDANIHPYVVFGNTGAPGWPVFDPQEYGIEPLSVMAVLCGEKLVYGIWGDMNGDDGEAAMVGEASISLATECFGRDMNGNNGYDGNDVLYLAFPGQDAVPGAAGAKWDAANFQEFESSISELGDRLMKRLDSASTNAGESDSDEEDQDQEEQDADQESSASRAYGLALGWTLP